MIKRLGTILAPLAIVMTLASCSATVSGTQVSQDDSSQASPSQVSTPADVPTPTPTPTPSPTPTEPPLSAIFASLPQQFIFSSGAGAWSTQVIIASDGTFTGQYHDSNMGDTGPGYPNGTVDQCNFSGKFEVTAKVSDYEYTLNLVSLNKEGNEGDQSIDNQILYNTVDNAYGLEGGSEFAFYLPGRSTDDFSQDLIMWVSSPTGWQHTAGDTLPYWVLYNVSGDQGLVGMDQ